MTHAGGRGKWLTLILLMLVGLFNYIDRLSMSILQVPIKAEMGLSDTQIGILTGLAFSLVYTTMSVPIARLADRYSRKLVILCALVVWSLMTAACGLATGFLVLAVLRMGVAIGEAGCVPASHAIISDTFRFDERARALAAYGLVFPVGTLLGFAASGWLSEALGWRQTFVVLGLAGLGLAPVVMLYLKEPRRGASDLPVGGGETPVQPGAGGVEAAGAGEERNPARSMSTLQALRQLWGSRAFCYLVVGSSILSYPLHASMVWNTAFYHRSFAMPIAELSVYLALLAGGAGGLGLYCFGSLADRLGRRDPRWYLWIPALSGLALLPAILAQYLWAPTARLSLLVGVVTVALMNAFLAPMMAMCQALAAPHLRSLASASAVFTAGLLGTVLGPVITGIVSDLLQRHSALGEEALRYAILTTLVAALLGAVLLLRGARFLAGDLRRARSMATLPA
ncbi:MAG: spinster family MFS transporter [Parahaliea sp.]